jgi:hypothetical protein
MKPYHIIVHVGATLCVERPEKFGTMGADDPAEAEKLVLELASAHAKLGETCSVAVFQLYRNYSSPVLSELVELREQAAEKQRQVTRSLATLRSMGETTHELRMENARLKREAEERLKPPAKKKGVKARARRKS